MTETDPPLELVELIQKARQTENAELELRFGKMVHGKFVSEIDEDEVHFLMKKIQTNSSMCIEDYVEINDFFWNKGDKKVRTRRLFDTNEIIIAPLEHTCKKRLQDVIVTTASDMAFKFSLSSEEQVEPDDLVQPTIVRRQHRKRFKYNNWSYEFKKVWEGKGESDVMKNISRFKWEFELELDVSKECVSKGDNYVALSFLLKGLDMIEEKNRRSFSVHNTRSYHD